MPQQCTSRVPLQFARDELEALQRDPRVCNRDRRTFLKWSTALAAQAAAGGALDLLSGGPVRADDTMANVARWVYSVCGYCSVGCGLHIGVDATGKAVFIKGNARHPTNAGQVCVKGLYEYKVLDDGQLRVGSRARYPLLRNAVGKYERITWQQAIDLLARRIADAVATSGPDSVGIYNTGQWTLEEYYSMGKLGKGAIGTSVMDSNTRLCMAAAVYGYMSTFGSDGPPGCYADIEHTDCFFLIGTNPAEMHPQVWRRIAKARATTRRPKLIVVDPRRTLTARSADLHLALRPGTNVALMNGILQQLITKGWIDRAYIDSHTRNFEALQGQGRGLYAAEGGADHRARCGGHRDRGALDRRIARSLVALHPGRVPEHGRDRHGAADLRHASRHRQDRPPRLGAVQHHRPVHRHEQPRGRRLVGAGGLPQLLQPGPGGGAGDGLERPGRPHPAPCHGSGQLSTRNCSPASKA
ncbi:MAG: molybdopterin-dependent oxidoreductase [Comamonadaceae bacterium]|nr:molybdopterin-dependent oxidoreductase [Comamonadaceae bacterium]